MAPPKGNIPWNKGMKGRKPWHNTSGLIPAKKGNTKGFTKGHKKNTGKKNGMFGKRPWNYIDGRSKKVSPARYGEAWNFIRMEIYKRDNFTCQDCGLPMTSKTGAHHVHHKKPFLESFDNSPSNLITLCKGCHAREEARLRKLNKESKNECDKRVGR